MYSDITQFEPLLISETRPPYRHLVGLAEELAESSARLEAFIPEKTAIGMRELVGGMNCYYSNMIEGHRTRPIDIDKAMRQDYSGDQEQQDMQHLARAHIETSRWASEADIGGAIPLSDFIAETHRRFCSQLPPSMLVLDDGSKMTPGKIRDRDVGVGQHVAPRHEAVSDFLARYDLVYTRAMNSASHGGLQKLEAITATMIAHHRLAWIHPFPDGNGRVARIVLDAMLKKCGLTSVGLWSMSRGFAKSQETYKSRLAAADTPRMGDIDGRGNLSEKRLSEFCGFGLEVAKDQVDFMRVLFSPEKIERRCRHYFSVMQDKIRPEAAQLYAHAFQNGEFDRGEASRLTGLGERTARDTLRDLTQAGFLVSDSPKGKVRAGFPAHALGTLFPNLYPAGDIDMDVEDEFSLPNPS